MQMLTVSVTQSMMWERAGLSPTIEDEAELQEVFRPLHPADVPVPSHIPHGNSPHAASAASDAASAVGALLQSP